MQHFKAVTLGNGDGSRNNLIPQFSASQRIRPGGYATFLTVIGKRFQGADFVSERSGIDHATALKTTVRGTTCTPGQEEASGERMRHYRPATGCILAPRRG